jgi:hypothetical protein
MAMVMVDAFLSTPSSTSTADAAPARAQASDEALYSQLIKFQLLIITALY